MSTSTNNKAISAVGLVMLEDGFELVTSDGQHCKVAYACYPRLEAASPEERKKFEVCAHGRLLHWPLIDEDIEVEHVLAGKYPVKPRGEVKNAAESRPKYGSGGNSHA